jgi:hypothetical protein
VLSRQWHFGGVVYVSTLLPPGLAIQRPDVYAIAQEQMLVRFSNSPTQMGIPVKVNIDSGGKPNGVPERR